MKRIAGRKRIKDRGIQWKEKYHERSEKLKDRYEKLIGPMAYRRWEGHDYTTNSDYFVVVGPALTKDGHKRFFAGIKKYPDDPKAKVYAPYGEYFTSIHSAYTHVNDKWGVPFPKDAPNYTVDNLQGIRIPRHVKGESYRLKKKAQKKNFIGNCIDGLNDNYFQNIIAQDATELAQIVEKGKEINLNIFLNLTHVDDKIIKEVQKNPERYSFFYNEDNDITWIYDEETDVEYFYK